MVFNTYVGSPNQLSYSWSGGETDSMIAVYHSGTYTVLVTDLSGCTASASETVTETIVQADIISAPGNVLSCLVDSVVLTASPAGMNYLWNNASTDSAIVVSNAAAYSLTVTDPGSGCSASFTTSVSALPSPSVNLGNDTTICISCNLTLDAGNNFAAYNWSTGAITSSVTVDTAGMYFVEVTDSNGCHAYDTIIVTKPSVGISVLSEEENNITLYHNPAANALVIMASAGLQNATAVVYNMLGEAVFSNTVNGKIIAIDISFLSPAVYIFQLTQHSKQHLLKFVKN